jgi:hypothetical protein
MGATWGENKMKIAKVNPPYKPLTQQKYCCFPCAIQWILLRRNLQWIDQEDIATMCDMRIPKKLKNLFKKKFKFTKNPSEYGTNVYTSKDRHIERLFKKYKVPLKVKRVLISEIEDPTEFVLKNIENGNDLMLDFHWYGLGKKEKSFNIGHVVVISEIKLEKNPIVILGDPGQNRRKFWEVSLSKLAKAMDKKYDGHERGFWIINS